jgi:hypothetical protein
MVQQTKRVSGKKSQTKKKDNPKQSKYLTKWKKWAQSYKGRKYWILAKAINNPETTNYTIGAIIGALGLYLTVKGVRQKKESVTGKQGKEGTQGIEHTKHSNDIITVQQLNNAVAELTSRTSHANIFKPDGPTVEV